MAFTGAAIVLKVSDNKLRVTGLSLGAGASGSIVMNQSGLLPEGTIRVAAPPEWHVPYKTSGIEGGVIDAPNAIECKVIVAEAGLAVTKAVSVVKTGDDLDDIQITLANPDAAASGALEIYLTYGS